MGPKNFDACPMYPCVLNIHTSLNAQYKNILEQTHSEHRHLAISLKGKETKTSTSTLRNPVTQRRRTVMYLRNLLPLQAQPRTQDKKNLKDVTSATSACRRTCKIIIAHQNLRISIFERMSLRHTFQRIFLPPELGIWGEVSKPNIDFYPRRQAGTLGKNAAAVEHLVVRRSKKSDSP